MDKELSPDRFSSRQTLRDTAGVPTDSEGVLSLGHKHEGSLKGLQAFASRLLGRRKSLNPLGAEHADEGAQGNDEVHHGDAMRLMLDAVHPADALDDAWVRIGRRHSGPLLGTETNRSKSRPKERVRGIDTGTLGGMGKERGSEVAPSQRPVVDTSDPTLLRCLPPIFSDPSMSPPDEMLVGFSDPILKTTGTPLGKKLADVDQSVGNLPRLQDSSVPMLMLHPKSSKILEVRSRGNSGILTAVTAVGTLFIHSSL